VRSLHRARRVGLLSLLRKLSSAFKKSAQETGAQIESAFADLPRCLLLGVPANVCSWEKSGRAADITAMTDFDPSATSTGSKSRSAQSPAVAEMCYPLVAQQFILADDQLLATFQT